MQFLRNLGASAIRTSAIGLFALASTAHSVADQKVRNNELIALYMGVAWAQSKAVWMEKCEAPRWQEAQADLVQQIATLKTKVLKLDQSEQAFSDALEKAKIQAEQEWRSATPQDQVVICQELSKAAEKSAKAIEKRN